MALSHIHDSAYQQRGRLRRAGAASSLKLETPILVGQLLNMQS